jgi:hypothetical protein
MGHDGRRAIWRKRVRWLATASALALVASCGKSTSGSDAGDEALSGGETAKGGNSGSAVGGALGGRGGVGVTTGGRSAIGGVAGLGGDSGVSGTGGSAGAAGCALEEVEDSLSHCPGIVSGREAPSSRCDFESTCEALGCGDAWSDFDAQGCLRPKCESSEDCVAGERCVPAVLAGVHRCYSSVFEWCDPNCSECACSHSEDCITAAFCQPADDFPPEADCNIDEASCDDLQGLNSTLAEYMNSEEITYTEDAALALKACADTISAPLAACEGSAGAPN